MKPTPTASVSTPDRSFPPSALRHHCTEYLQVKSSGRKARSEGALRAPPRFKRLLRPCYTELHRVHPGRPLWSFAADGECPSDLVWQDGQVITVLEGGFIVEIDGDRLTVTSSGGEGPTRRLWFRRVRLRQDVRRSSGALQTRTD